MLPFLTLALVTTASAACTRALLHSLEASYIQAQTTGSLTPLTLSTTLDYRENDTPLTITSSILTTAFPIAHYRTLYDTTACAIHIELNAANAPHPYVIHTQIRLSPDTASITTIHSVVSDEGDWIFDAKGHLNWTKSEDWSPPSTALLSSRDVLKAAADAYLNQWGNSTLPVPFGTPCARLEGGMYTGSKDTKGNTCKMPAFPVPLKVGNRRYVIDEEGGGVGVLNDFPWLEKSKGEGGTTPSANMFFVTGGKIRYIHEVTVCATRMCGR